MKRDTTNKDIFFEPTEPGACNKFRSGARLTFRLDHTPARLVNLTPFPLPPIFYQNFCYLVTVVCE